MANKAADDTKVRLKGIQGAGGALRGGTMKAADQAVDSRPNHSGNKTRKAVSFAPPVAAAQNYDEAPPGQPGPEHSGENQERPAFTRGPSVIDNTAVTSAAPTPAGEISNPMAFGLAKAGSRRRESHLPDGCGDGTPKKPDDEISGTDQFAPELSRQKTETGSRDTTSGWEG